MHGPAVVEEVKTDPFDFFIDVGSLVLEGRVPTRSSKGYAEGLHCPPASQAQARHQCDPAAVLEVRPPFARVFFARMTTLRNHLGRV